MDTKQAGSIGGRKRMSSLTQLERKDLASKAIYKRWGKAYQGLSIKPTKTVHSDDDDSLNPIQRCKICRVFRVEHEKDSFIAYHQEKGDYHQFT